MLLSLLEMHHTKNYMCLAIMGVGNYRKHPYIDLQD